MIESNIIRWVNLGESMQFIDVYGKPKWAKFFGLIRVMMSFKKFSIFFYIVLKCFFFLQIAMLTLTNVTDNQDSAIQILNYIKSVIFVQDIVTDQTSYKVAVILNTVLTVVSILCIIFLMISMQVGKFFMKIPLVLLNLINVVVINYLIGPIIFVSLMATKCTNGMHDYLQVACFTDITHIIVVIVSVINFLFFMALTIILSIYYNEIGTINETKFMSRINCNYEIYTTLAKMSMFFLAYFVKFYGIDSLGNVNNTWKIIMQIYMLLNCLTWSTYVYKYVFFYDARINLTILYGWVFVFWFSLVILLKSILTLSDTSIFHVAGWLILATIIYLMEDLKEEYLLTDFNIFEAKSLKDIELFNYKLFNLINLRSIKNKTLLIGIINKFEEILSSNDELKEKYHRLNGNEKLKKKFNSASAFKIVSILYIVYDHHLDKSVFKNDILLIYSYFLINRFRNVIFAVYLLSKIKAVSHKHLYLKYLLMEEIKASQINKLSKSNNKESVKHIQIGSVILYNTYIDMFKVKIFDAACNQIDYFEILRNNVTTPKTTDNFMKMGEDILIIRKEILQTWDRIIELNPFSEECFKDYMLYLQTILQDDTLARSEAKKFTTLRSSRLSDKNSVYQSMFNINSGVILIDGYYSFGKVLYATPNLPLLFNFSSKDAATMTIDDVSPNIIKDIHREVIDHGVRYTNIQSLFGNPRDILLKGKTGSIFNIKVYIKCVPNLSFGLIYIINVTKSADNNFVVLLEKDFKINGLTELFSTGTTFTTNPYSIDRSVVTCHIAVLMPSILLDLEYEEKEGMYIFPKLDTDMKCMLYTLSSNKTINEKIERILEKIKQSGRLLSAEDNNNTEALKDYEDLLAEITAKSTHSHSVFFRFQTRKLLMGKYRYHKIMICNDLISMEEASTLQNGNSSAIERKKKDKKSPSENNPDVSKQIKIKIHPQNFVSGEEEKKLIEEKDGKEDAKDNAKKNEAIEENKQAEGASLGSANSFASKSSVDSASFNKLKEGILDKKEISSIKFMKYLSFSFGVGTILLVFLASQNSNSKFSNLNDYLLQNLFFNHSKIVVSCVYLSTLNLKYMRDQVYTQDHCYSGCKSFYSSLLAECISEIKSQKENSSLFYSDFTSILSRQKSISLELYNLTEVDVTTIDVNNNLNLLIALGLKVNSNLDDYLINPISIINTVALNLLTQTLIYIDDSLISGFTNTQKQTNITNLFSTVNIILIIEGILFCILIVAFTYLICSLFSLESFYLKQLIKFKNPPFDAYLKKLDEIKKRLRNDNGEDEDKMNNEMEDQNAKESKRSKDDDDKDKKNDKKKKKGGDDDEDDEKDKKGGLKRKNKKKVGRNHQEDKISIMGKYFLYWNIFFCIKVVAILLLSVSYYLVVSIIDQSTTTQLLSFDSTSNDIEGVFKQSFDIYVGLKTELASYINAQTDKRNNAAYLTSYPGSTVTYNGVQYTKASDVLNSNYYYNMNLPQQVVTPKIGSLLMPLVNTDLTTASVSIVTLNNLYNADGCAVLFNKVLQAIDYNFCANFWSNILIKGMEQAITQMSVVVTTVLDDLHSLNLQKKSLAEVIAVGSPFSGYELFVEFYLFKAYMETVKIFNTLNSENLQVIYNIYKGIMIAYICFVVILFSMLLYFVYKSKYIFNTFMNFIGILPSKYLIEDQLLYKEILKLEAYIY